MTPSTPRPICVHLRSEGVEPDDIRNACEAVQRAMDQLDVPVATEIALVFADDEKLARLNETYRGESGPTDVLAFPSAPDNSPAGEAPYLGDVLISVESASRNAAAAGSTLNQELCLLAVHGLLHLLGYDDSTEDGAAAMRALETQLGVR